MSSQETSARLKAPFAVDEISWKPQAVKGGKALALAYIDARTVQRRLDDVVGVGGWRTEFVHVGEGCVECRLSLRIDGEWITKADVGVPSDQKGGDQKKAAYSDALKRAAVAFGVGRYLYDLPQTWVDYDTKSKRLRKTPKLPSWAIPKNESEGANQTAPRPQESFLSEDQVITINDLLDQINEPWENLCNVAQVSDLASIPSEKFESLTAHLVKLGDILKIASSKGIDKGRILARSGKSSGDFLRLNNEEKTTILEALKKVKQPNA